MTELPVYVVNLVDISEQQHVFQEKHISRPPKMHLKAVCDKMYKENKNS